VSGGAGALVWLVLATCSTAWFATGSARRWLVERGVVDVPNHRSSHDRIVPRGGGVVIVVVTMLATLIAWWMSDRPDGSLVAIAAASVVLAALGLLDDVRDLAVRVRLGVQGSVAVAVVGSLVLAGDFSAGASIGMFLTGVVFVVASMNIFNFMDGIDGIAGLTALGFAFPATIVATAVGAAPEGVAAAALGGTVLGFLIHNWSPARIFMGDSGSLFLGFLATALPLSIARSDPRGVFLLGAQVPFIVDGALTIIRRHRQGARVTDAHRDHVYQRAARRWGHAPVATGYGVAALASSSLVLAAGWSSWPTGVAAGALVLAGAITTWVVLSRRLDRV
jgi:Fuc2NAc and GlcNAc transferase